MQAFGFTTLKTRPTGALLVLFCLVARPMAGQPGPTYPITEFGAKADGTTMNTAFINRAIETCHQRGGGTVLVPPGRFLTGTVVLRSNVTLHLLAGAVLLGSRDTSDYRPMKSTLFHEGYNRYGMVYAADARNISITGPGEINGNGTAYMNGLDKPHLGRDWDRQYTRQGEAYMKAGTIFEDGPVSYAFRPGMLLTIERCENVKVTDVSLLDTPEWTVRLDDCEDAVFRGVTIRTNQLIPNSDGIHVTSSRNVRISDCNIVAGDDAIIVTGFGNGPRPTDSIDPNRIGNKTGYAENVVVTNCVLSSRSACIRVGYGDHPIRNLIFSNLVMYASNRGIGVFARSRSVIENVFFDNILIQNRLHSGHWWGKGEPIHVSALRDNEAGPAGQIRNVRFTNINAQSETGILVYGAPDARLENITLKDVQLTISRGRYTDSYGGNFDVRPAHSKAAGLFKHDIPALYAQYVNGLSVRGLTVRWGEALPGFFTHAVEVNQFEGFRLEDFDGTANGKALPAVKLTDGKNARLTLNPGTTLARERVN
jgi:hypothetical protein